MLVVTEHQKREFHTRFIDLVLPVLIVFAAIALARLLSDLNVIHNIERELAATIIGVVLAFVIAMATTWGREAVVRHPRRQKRDGERVGSG